MGKQEEKNRVVLLFSISLPPSLSPVPFEGDASWQHRRSLKINGVKGGSDSLSAGCSSPGWPDWSWMSLLLLNLVYVKQPDMPEELSLSTSV